MNCGFSRTLLALYVEGDLSGAQSGRTAMHLATCAECRQFVDELQESQSLLRSLRRDTVDRDACAVMRQDVMRIIDGGQLRTGFWLRVERAFFGVRAWHAVAAALIVSIVSVSVLAQMRQPAADSLAALKTPAAMPKAIFEGRDVLLKPDGYDDWVVVGASQGRQHPGGNVLMNPSSYRDYLKTGRFPEGTMMVWASAETGALLASVKDRSRFDGGWGFFEFGPGPGSGESEGRALPDSGSCRTCHRRDAATDHVFTQFYPALRDVTHT